MYTTLTKVKLGITTTLTDEQITSIINFVSRYMDYYVGYKLASLSRDNTKDYYLDGSGTQYLFFPYPLNGSWELEDTESGLTLVSGENYVRYPLNAPHTTYVGMKYGTFGRGMAQYRVIGAKLGRFVYDDTGLANTFPEELVMLATQISQNLVKKGGEIDVSGFSQKSGNIQSETTGSYSVSFTNSKQNSSLFEKSLNDVPTGASILSQYIKTASMS